MQKLNNNQKIYISLPKKDYVESQAEQMVIEQDTTIWQKMIEFINQLIHKN